MVERVFEVLGLSDEPYYRAQAKLAFGRLCRLLHGMRDESREGFPFTLNDVAIALKGLVSHSPDAEKANPWNKALLWCLKHSTDREAAEELNAEVARKGDKLEKDLTGLVAALEQFQSPLVNAYAPDIVFEEAMEKNLLLYAQLPSNLHRIQAPALGKVMLAEVQYQTAQRQVHRTQRNQTPFTLNIDEFATFASMGVVEILNKARDAHVWLTLSHQSFADLDAVDAKLRKLVWDNTRTKDILVQDDPEVCEQLAKSLGTRPEVEHTVQQGPDVMGTLAATGVMSTRAVDKYILHPNALRSLLPCGQGYLFATRPGDRMPVPTVYGPLPEACRLDYELKRNSQSKARGLRLKERFIAARPAVVFAAPVAPVPASRPPPKGPVPALPPRAASERPKPVLAATTTRGTKAVPPPPPPDAGRPFEGDTTPPDGRSVLHLPPPPPPEPQRGGRQKPELQQQHADKAHTDESAKSRPTVLISPLKKKVSNG
jgi:hypothetical protein